MVVDYSKAKVYKIYNDKDDDIYIGSTCCSLGMRMVKHRQARKSPRQSHYRLYKKMNEIGVENFHIVLVEEMPECQNKEQLHKKEREIIEKLKPVLNYAIPTRTFQELVEDNREYVREFDRNYRRKNRKHRNETLKQWRDNNPDKVKEYKKTDYEKNREKYCAKLRQPCQCEICGKKMVKGSLTRHMKTQHS